MVAHAKLPKTFWAEALMTVTHMINISPSAPLEGDTPRRVWTAKDVSYQNLKVFGCLTYVYIAKHKREKLDLKSRSGIFLGYGNDEFSYRVWDLVDKKVFRSR